MYIFDGRLIHGVDSRLKYITSIKMKNIEKYCSTIQVIFVSVVKYIFAC